MTGNQSPIDLYTAGHVAVGFAARRWFGLGLVPVLTLGLLWEVTEDTLKTRNPGIFPLASPDSKVNALFDLGAFVLGYWLAGLNK